MMLQEETQTVNFPAASAAVRINYSQLDWILDGGKVLAVCRTRWFQASLLLVTVSGRPLTLSVPRFFCTVASV